MSAAQLQGAMLDNTQLREALLDSAEFQGATLIGNQLQDARLYNAEFQGAILLDTQLQGAMLDGAQLQGGLLRHVFVWRADSRKAHDAEGARIEAVETDPKKMPCAGRSIDACDQDETSEDRLFKLGEVAEPQRKPRPRVAA
jgi:hypothetical protein